MAAVISYQKAYIIIHDGTNVLVGTGGKSGRKKNTRRGYHLPGGTVEGLDDKGAVAAVKREFGEETNISAEQITIKGSVQSPEIEGTDILFVVATVESVDNLVAGFDRPDVLNQYDEPFEGLVSMPIEDCWENDNFSDNYWTDWFGLGLKAAFNK